MTVETLKRKNKVMYAKLSELVDKHHFGDPEIRKNNFRRMALAIRNKLNLLDSRGYDFSDDNVHLMRFYLQAYMITRLIFDPLDKVIQEIEELSIDEIKEFIDNI